MESENDNKKKVKPFFIKNSKFFRLIIDSYMIIKEEENTKQDPKTSQD